MIFSSYPQIFILCRFVSFTNDYLYIVSCCRRFSASPKSFYYHSKLFTTQCFLTPPWIHQRLSLRRFVSLSFQCVAQDQFITIQSYLQHNVFQPPMIFSSYPQTFILRCFVSSSFRCVAQNQFITIQSYLQHNVFPPPKTALMGWLGLYNHLTIICSFPEFYIIAITKHYLDVISRVMILLFMKLSSFYTIHVSCFNIQIF